ncbi:MAG: cytochrome c4 [Gammaproteobacteria bacterium]|nr:MAG: cytochrome c4 [Gammaproteobacteria bacterium]RKZ40020.1 MAG: cytochrome c4 [Gammaproteobacteria bacterium]RKZ72660.1 MAG: cytochrome c4 [Gammaproteobacteria bacterium]
MTIYKTTKYILLLVGSLMLNITWADDGSLFMLVGNCMGCHGPNGVSLGPATPNIAGMNPSTFVKAMEEFRDEERPSTVMRHIAKGYSDEDFQTMADYFVKQAFIPYQQTVDADKVKKGAKLHQKYCQKCHTNSVHTIVGSTNLAGQWMLYLQFTLVDIYTGVRDMPIRVLQIVENMVQLEGIESVDNLIHFYASQTEHK